MATSSISISIGVLPSPIHQSSQPTCALPDVIVGKAFSYLEGRDLCVVQRVNKKWNKISREGDHWKYLCLIEPHFRIPAGVSSPEEYRKHYTTSQKLMITAKIEKQEKEKDDDAYKVGDTIGKSCGFTLIRVGILALTIFAIVATSQGLVDVVQSSDEELLFYRSAYDNHNFTVIGVDPSCISNNNTLLNSTCAEIAQNKLSEMLNSINHGTINGFTGALSICSSLIGGISIIGCRKTEEAHTSDEYMGPDSKGCRQVALLNHAAFLSTNAASTCCCATIQARAFYPAIALQTCGVVQNVATQKRINAFCGNATGKALTHKRCRSIVGPFLVKCVDVVECFMNIFKCCRSRPQREANSDDFE